MTSEPPAASTTIAAGASSGPSDERRAPRDGRLTVVVPNYNHGHFIGEALDSVIRQARRPDRVIVIDDGSTDDSVSIIEDYAQRDRLIELHRHELNRGVVPNLNQGLALADSEYITFLAADDFVMRDLYATTLELLGRHPGAPLCSVLVDAVDEQGHIHPQPRPVALGSASRYLSPAEVARVLTRHGSVFNGNGAVYRTAALRGIGGFDPALGARCDGYALQLLAARHGACYVPLTLAAWRQLEHSYAAQTTRSFEISLNLLDVVRSRLNGPDADAFPPECRRRMERRLRFATAAAGLSDATPDFAAVASLLHGPAMLQAAVSRLGRIAGPRVMRLAMFALLRPWDIASAVVRRIPDWPRPSVQPLPESRQDRRATG